MNPTKHTPTPEHLYLQGDVDALTARIAELEAALRQIVKEADGVPRCVYADIARAALAKGA
jgi:hypothetical protein